MNNSHDDQMMHHAAKYLHDLQNISYLNYIKGISSIDRLILDECSNNLKSSLNALGLDYFKISLNEKETNLELPIIYLEVDSYTSDLITRKVAKINELKADYSVNFFSEHAIISDKEFIPVAIKETRTKYLKHEYGLRITFYLSKIKSLPKLILIIKNMLLEIESVSLSNFWVNNQVGKSYIVEKANPWSSFNPEPESLNLCFLNLGFPTPSYLTKLFFDQLLMDLESIKNKDTNTVLDQKKELARLKSVYNAVYGQFVVLNVGEN